MNTKIQLFFDRTSMGISILCAMHCAAMPLILLLSPSLQLVYVNEHLFHQFLVLIIIPASLLAGFLGCKKHKDIKVMIRITLGLGTLSFTAIWGHDVLGEVGELIATVLSSILLASAHLLNFKLCKKNSCNQCAEN